MEVLYRDLSMEPRRGVAIEVFTATLPWNHAEKLPWSPYRDLAMERPRPGSRHDMTLLQLSMHLFLEHCEHG